MYAEEKLKAEIARELIEKSGEAISTTRDGSACQAAYAVSVRVACSVLGVSESCYRYKAKLATENAIVADRLLRLTGTHKRWGFGLCFLYLRNVKGFGWNHKRVYRLYRELELVDGLHERLIH